MMPVIIVTVGWKGGRAELKDAKEKLPDSGKLEFQHRVSREVRVKSGLFTPSDTAVSSPVRSQAWACLYSASGTSAGTFA